MTNIEIIYIVLIAISAMGIAIFQYFYKSKISGSHRYIFTLLRFLSLFLLGFLLLNPSINKKVITNIKPNLVVAIDNSESIGFLGKSNQVNRFIKDIKNSSLSDKFNLQFYSFGSAFKKLPDTLSFSDNQTNISEAFTSLNDLYKNTNSPTLLLTDGNQTLGEDYVLNSYSQPIYPIVLGDSILKEDIYISNIQHNKYTFIDNEFPIELTVNYIGTKDIVEDVTVYSGKTKVYSKKIKLSINNPTIVIDFLLKAKNIGKLKYTAKVSYLKNEINLINNKRDFSVEVIDEKSNVLIVSDIIHPDLGALKKSIESNEQRNVEILKSDDLIDYNNYQLLVLYQPTSKFKSVYRKIHEYKKNHLTITGLQTDWFFLNNISKNFSNDFTDSSQEYFANFNSSFNLFQTKKLNYLSYPPLIGVYGNIILKNKGFTLLYQQINSINTKSPLLCFFENDINREAVLFGEGIWKWRSYNYVFNKNFNDFDMLLGKTIQYLSSNRKRDRLVISSKKSYLLGQAELSAQYFDKNYVFDSNEVISCKLINEKTNEIFDLEFLYNKNEYVLDLKHLSPGLYTYIVKVNKNNLIKKGDFDVIDFNIESQFINPNVTKLGELATNSKTELIYLSNYSKIIKHLEINNKFKTLQKEKKIQLPLIKLVYLLGALIVLLGVEWFFRKYKGLV